MSGWVAETKARRLAVRNESVQRLIEVMQTPVAKGGNLPVDTGFLRASLMAAIGSANFTVADNPDPEAKYSYDPGQITLVIAGAKITDPIEAVYLASYSRHQEYGARGRPGRRFVALAAQQWPRVVDEVCRELQLRAGG